MQFAQTHYFYRLLRHIARKKTFTRRLFRITRPCAGPNVRRACAAAAKAPRGEVPTRGRTFYRRPFPPSARARSKISVTCANVSAMRHAPARSYSPAAA